MYEFKINQFEGPMDLLLHLIQKAQIDIKDIFISEITTQFIDYVEKNQSNMDDVSEFLETAATLVYIKSKRLLPKRQVEEEEDIEEQFIIRLEEYNRFKQLSEKLREEIEKTPKTFTKYKDELVMSDKRIDLKEITLDALVEAFKKLMEERREERELPVLTSQKVMRRDKYTIIEKMDYIMTRVSKKGRMSFEEVFDSHDRGDMVVSFLAMLELLNKGQLMAYQDGAYNDIVIELRKEEADG